MFARIENGLVVELIPDTVEAISEEGEAPVTVGIEDRFHPDFVAALVPAGDDVQVGWSFANGEFAAPQAPRAAVPQSVSMRQARLALLAAGQLQAVEDAIDAIPDAETRQATRVDWDYATTVERNSGAVELLAAALNMNEETVDALFTDAAGR